MGKIRDEFAQEKNAKGQLSKEDFERELELLEEQVTEREKQLDALDGVDTPQAEIERQRLVEENRQILISVEQTQALLDEQEALMLKEKKKSDTNDAMGALNDGLEIEETIDYEEAEEPEQVEKTEEKSRRKNKEIDLDQGLSL